MPRKRKRKGRRSALFPFFFLAGHGEGERRKKGVLFSVLGEEGEGREQRVSYVLSPIFVFFAEGEKKKRK